MASSRRVSKRKGFSLVAALAALALPATASAFDAQREALNFQKTEERQLLEVATPDFLQRLETQNAAGFAEAANITLTDPERDNAGNVCRARMQECAGEIRFYDWEEEKRGLKRPVLFVGRSGAILSGTVWATRKGPEQRPGVVITTGSVQAPETLYWGLAANLAKRGYVVLTYDVQGQGLSDTFGDGPDRLEGVPSQAGQPFYDGTEDALDFLTSTPRRPYEPRPSCSTGASHADRQARRVEAGLNTANNPLWRFVDRSRIGISGHSLGASAVSFVGQEDRRVDALVAYDNLASSVGEGGGRFATPTCASAPKTRRPTGIRKPGLGISNDYGIVPTPFASDPDRQGKSEAFLAYRKAGVDSMQVNIRGGTHEESAFIPGSTIPYPLGSASLFGHDLVIWYTAAWFDRYVKCEGRGGRCERRADRLLLSDRWLDDPREEKIDAAGDPNLLSFYFRSRYDVGLADGKRVRCRDMRSGCSAMGGDPLPRPFSYLDAGLADDRGRRPSAGVSRRTGRANQKVSTIKRKSG